MSVSLTERGRVSACAYTGCWEGRAQALKRSAKFLYASGSFPFSSGGNKADLAITIARRTGVATFIGGAGYAHPMICTR